MVLEAPELLLAAPEILLAVPEMVPARKLELEPVMESAKALVTAQSNRWVLSSQPWASFAVADLLTW